MAASTSEILGRSSCLHMIILGIKIFHNGGSRAAPAHGLRMIPPGSEMRRILSTTISEETA